MMTALRLAGAVVLAVGLSACETSTEYTLGDGPTWQVQYLSHSFAETLDHPLAIVVAPGEHEFVEAYYRGSDGRGIYVGCDPIYNGDAPELAFGQRGDSAFLGAGAAMVMQFDTGATVPIPFIGVEDARYWTPLTQAMVDGLTTAQSVTVRTTSGALVIDAPLVGAAQSIAVLDCLSRAAG